MAKVFYEADGNPDALEGKTIAVLGYGSQGHAHALNLRDSGASVVVGLPPTSKSRPKAEKEGLRVVEPGEAAKRGDIIMVLIPDPIQPKVYQESIEPNLKAGNMLMFAHGFSIHYKFVVPPKDVDVTMIAPKSPGHRLRELFVEGQGVPGLVAVEQDATGQALPLALAYAKGLGCLRAGVIQTTYKEETESDLFGEQSVLCGGVSALVKASFDTLVEAGYQPEIAYFECMHELKLIVDLIYEGGLSYMRYSVSDTAEYGDYPRGPVVVDDHVKQQMKKILAGVQDGSFAREWMEENAKGGARFRKMRKDESELPIEKVGRELRKMMAWTKKPEEAPVSS